MATKLVKVHDMDEALRLWKAGLLVNRKRGEWSHIKYFPHRSKDVLHEWMWNAYMLADSDDEE